MGYYADLMKEKKLENAYAKLVKKLSDFDIYEDAEGYFMRVKDGKVVKGGYLSIGDAETDGHRAKSASKDNEKENSILSTEMYKGYKIEVYKAKAGVDYGFNIYDKSGALFDWGTYFDSERDALRWAKLAIDRKNNSKEEKGYYAKLAEEKASRKN